VAVRFDASADALSRTTNLPGFPCTIMGWFYLSADRGALANAIAYGDSSGGADVQLGIDQAVSTGQLMIWDALNVVTGTTLSLSTWYHLALTISSVDGAGSALGYLDGVLDITNPNVGSTVSSELLWIGNDNDAEWLNGRAAAIKVYSAVLSAAEIQQEMRQYLPARTANINAWYPLLSVADDEIDFSGNARTWTVGGTLATEDGPPIPWKAGQSKIYLPLSADPGGGAVVKPRSLLTMGCGC
jgi:hypothetical protein